MALDIVLVASNSAAATRKAFAFASGQSFALAARVAFGSATNHPVAFDIILAARVDAAPAAGAASDAFALAARVAFGSATGHRVAFDVVIAAHSAAAAGATSHAVTLATGCAFALATRQAFGIAPHAVALDILGVVEGSAEAFAAGNLAAVPRFVLGSLFGVLVLIVHSGTSAPTSSIGGRDAQPTLAGRRPGSGR